MHPLALLIIAGGNLTLGIIAWLYFKRFQRAVLKHNIELEKRERDLKRKVLELQVLRSLGERAGYSLDLKQILDVIIDSLEGLVDFSTVSYMVLGKEGKILFKLRAQEPISHNFLSQVKNQMLISFSAMTGQNLQPMLMEETVSGGTVADVNNVSIGSFFNLPVVIGGKAVALVNISSTKKGLYGDTETAILYTIFNQVSIQAGKLVQVIENEKRRLSAMVGSLADGILMTDPSFNVIVSNPILPRLLNLKRDVGSLYDVVAAIGTKVNLKQALEETLNKQILVSLPEFEIEGKALQIDVEPVKDKFGYLLGVAVVFHDITARKALERLREDFTAMMVHELRTPLTTISYSVDMLETDFPKMQPEDLRGNLKVIRSTTENMLSLVSELLDIAKIEAGKFIVIKTDGDLNQLLEEKIMAFKPLATQKNLGLAADLAPTLHQVSFDKNRLGQAINNLLSNALKYTDSGKVEIKAEDTEGQVVVSISDTGEGIKSEDVPKLFSKFEQLGKGKTGDKGGTGLGLVVTKGIIEAHGGKIWAESAGLGKGTTFSFSIPIK